MTIHYHGTPITPGNVLRQLAGKNFCVSFASPENVGVCHEIGQSVMLDNGAFSYWRSGISIDWKAFYKWVRPWLDCQSTWAVIPDVIGGTEEENDELIDDWDRHIGSEYWNAAPVWHLHESLERLDSLMDFSRVCFGSSGEFSQVGSPAWNNRVNEAFNMLCKGTGRPKCAIHMLRGMSLSGSIYPFASVDSTDIARNHNRKNNAREMADRWDSMQCAIRWVEVATQPSLLEEIA